MHINDKIKEVRQLMKMSQQAFADLLEEKRSTYAEWEDKIIPSFDKIVKISAKTGISILEFVAVIDKNVAQGVTYDDNSSVPVLKDPDGVYIKNNVAYFIELKTASGKPLRLLPEGQTEIELLNAFLEERDRVLDERNRIIDKIETQTQARIDELKKDKDQLTQKLNLTLEKIYTSQQVALGYQKAWVDYEAEKVAKGDQNKKKELMYKMGKLVDGMIENDASKGTPDEIGKKRKA
jgi:transcriptional regulator with XRE-family HTH domain